MELRQVRAFVEVATHLHFGRAAQALNVTQPALSQRVRQLELELRTRLLERTSRQVRLSPAGERFLPYALRLVEDAERALAAMRPLADGAAAQLRLAYYLGGESAVPVRLVGLFRQRHAGVEIESSFGYSAPNLARLRAGEVDLAFVRLPIHDSQGLLVVRVDAVPFLLALPSHHPLASQRRVALSQLAAEKFISFPREFNPGQYDYIAGAIEDATGAPVSVVAERPSAEAMIAAVAEGLGVCLCSALRSRQMRMAGVTFRRLRSTDLMAQLGLVAREEDAEDLAGRFLRLAADATGAGQPSPAFNLSRL